MPTNLGLCLHNDVPEITALSTIPDLAYDLRAENAIVSGTEVLQVLNYETAGENMPPVTRLEDQVSSVGPQYEYNCINGQACIHLDSQRPLVSAHNFSDKPFTICILGKNFDTTGTQGNFIAEKGDNGMAMGVVKNSDNTFSVAGMLSTFNSQPTSLKIEQTQQVGVFCVWSAGFTTDPTPHAPPAEVDGTGQFRVAYSFNGRVADSVTQMYSGQLSDGGMMFGCGHTSPANPDDPLYQPPPSPDGPRLGCSNLAINQIVYYSRMLSVPERIAVENSLALRGGVTMTQRPANTPYALMQWTVQYVIDTWTSDHNMIREPMVVWDETTQEYYLYYCIAQDQQYGYITFAHGPNLTSLSGLDNPPRALGSSDNSWDSVTLSGPFLFYDPVTQLWYLFYKGSSDLYLYGQSTGIGYATSTSPAGPWTKSGAPIAGLMDNTNNVYGMSGKTVTISDPSVSRGADGTYYLFFAWRYFDNGFNQIAYATASAITGPYTLHLTPSITTPAVARSLDDSGGTANPLPFTGTSGEPVAIASIAYQGIAAYSASLAVSPWPRYPVMTHGIYGVGTRLHIVPNSENRVAVLDNSGSNLLFARADPIDVPTCVQPPACRYAGNAFASTCYRAIQTGTGVCTISDEPHIDAPNEIPNLCYDLRAENAVIQTTANYGPEVLSVPNAAGAPTNVPPVHRFEDEQTPIGPSYEENCINGLPCMSTTSRSMLLVSDNDFIRKPFTVCMLLSFPNGDYNQFGNVFGERGTYGTKLGVRSDFSGNQFSAFYRNDRYLLSPLKTDQPDEVAVFCAWSGGLSVDRTPPTIQLDYFTNDRLQVAFSYNGKLSDTVIDSNYYNNQDGGGMLFGCGLDSTTPQRNREYCAQIKVQHILYYDRMLTIPERVAVENFLGTRGGLDVLPSRRPAPTVYPYMQWRSQRAIVTWDAVNDFIKEPAPVYDATNQEYYLFYSIWPDQQNGFIAFVHGPSLTNLSSTATPARAIEVTPGAWDSGSVSSPFPFYDVVTGLWYLFYRGSTIIDFYGTSSNIGYATAPELKGPWTKSATVCVGLDNANGGFDSYNSVIHVSDPDVHRAGDGTYVMHYVYSYDGQNAQKPVFATAPSITGPWTPQPSPELVPSTYDQVTEQVNGISSVHTYRLRTGERVALSSLGNIATSFYSASPTVQPWPKYPVLVSDFYTAGTRMRFVPNTDYSMVVFDDTSSNFFIAQADDITLPVCL